MSLPLFDKIRDPNCKDCSLWKTAQSVCLIGDGPYPAEIMLVGEAPGWREDNVRKPFAGKAGRLLDSILEAVGIQRREVYITNAVHCRPPDNRKPSADEVAACHQYLERECSSVRPKLIIALGGTALKSLVGKGAPNITAARGKTFEYRGAKVLPTFHPAAALRTPALAEYIVEDIQRGLKMLNGSGPTKARTNYTLITKKNIREVSDELRAGDEAVAFDIEATGLDMYDPEQKLLSIALSPKPGTAYFILVEHPKGEFSKEQIAKFFKEVTEGKRLVGHNVKFDLRWISTRLGFIPNCQIRDTMVMFHLIDENYPDKQLKHLVRIHTKLGPLLDKWEAEAKVFMPKGQGFKNDIPVDKLMLYNCGDADGTRRLYKKFVKWLKQEELMKLMQFQGEITRLLLEIELSGFTISVDKKQQLAKEYKKSLEKLHNDLVEPFRPDLNLNSPKQLAKLLYKDMKLPVTEKTPTGEPSVSEAVLLTLAQDPKTPDRMKKWLKQLLEYRSSHKLYTAYLIGLDLKKDGRVHANYRQTGTVTGRLSCSDPNLQQIPREGPIKGMFVSSREDGLIVQADYNQIELRVLAHKTGDRGLLQAFEDKKDIHIAAAAKVFRIPEKEVTEQQRKFAKQVNFGIAYCISARGLAAKTGVPLHRAEHLIAGWMREFPAVPQWITQVRKDAMKYHMSWTEFGRRRRFTEVDPDSNEGRESLRQAVNFPIQSLASDITVLSTLELWRWLQKEEMESKIVANVHDSVILDCPKDEVKKVAKKIKEIFEDPPTEYEFGFKMKVPLVVDVKIGESWGQLEKEG